MKAPSTLLIALASGLLTACSSGPPMPKPGTPAFSWAEAKDGYRTGDLLKTDTALLKLAGSENSFTARACVWQLVVSAGLTQGFSELADAYEAASLRTVDKPLRFRTEAAKLRSAAATAALEFAQAVHNMVIGDDKDVNVKLAFGFPPGSAVPPEGLLRISSGLWPRDSERELVATAMLQRGVLRSVSTAVGFPEDTAGAEELFQTSEVQVPREVFVEAMAKLLYQESDLFGPQRMDRPDRLMLMCREAFQALQSVPQTEDRKELIAKIQETLKKNGGV